MTIEEAKKEISSFKDLNSLLCRNCNNIWYCPDDCAIVEKSRIIPFEKIIASYARNDGDIRKLFRYIRNFRL